MQQLTVEEDVVASVEHLRGVVVRAPNLGGATVQQLDDRGPHDPHGGGRGAVGDAGAEGEGLEQSARRPLLGLHQGAGVFFV